MGAIDRYSLTLSGPWPSMRLMQWFYRQFNSIHLTNWLNTQWFPLLPFQGFVFVSSEIVGMLVVEIIVSPPYERSQLLRAHAWEPSGYIYIYIYIYVCIYFSGYIYIYIYTHMCRRTQYVGSGRRSERCALSDAVLVCAQHVHAVACADTRMFVYVQGTVCSIRAPACKGIGCHAVNSLLHNWTTWCSIRT